MPVMVTGHTGFKGSWLSVWLKELGAEVIGYSLEPPSTPNNFEALRLSGRVVDVQDDIRNLDALRQTIAEFKPQVVFHLAAQTIVSESYANPQYTFDANVLGTVNVLEAVRSTSSTRSPSSVRAVVCITTDKCYENREWVWGYRENDRLGGHDPYSASKAMAELAVSSYRQSFFSPEKYDEHGIAVASTRAGNVIGGGDWGVDRLVPDCVRALAEGRTIHVRNPYSVRPWQLVLEPLSGYLWLAVRLLQDGGKFAQAWNFGPPERVPVNVGGLVQEMIQLWGSGDWEDISSDQALHETGLLMLNWEKAANYLDWQPVYAWREALAETVDWFKEYYEGNSGADMYGACVSQIRRYVDRARELGAVWTKSMGTYSKQ
ncbi:MAG: CDP-glucose 4,6-dehydratase [Chloroflexi bacterium]|nr:CDP-glucose 4,6-dehydratase [Chloroflexota bacterium]